MTDIYVIYVFLFLLLSFDSVIDQPDMEHHGLADIKYTSIELKDDWGGTFKQTVIHAIFTVKPLI